MTRTLWKTFKTCQFNSWLGWDKCRPIKSSSWLVLGPCRLIESNFWWILGPWKTHQIWFFNPNLNPNSNPIKNWKPTIIGKYPLIKLYSKLIYIDFYMIFPIAQFLSSIINTCVVALGPRKSECFAISCQVWTHGEEEVVSPTTLLPSIYKNNKNNNNNNNI